MTVALAVTDSAGSVTNTLYRVDTGADRTYSGPFVVSGSGSHTVTYHSIDNKGNVEPAETTTFQIAAPSITALPAGGTYKAVVSLSGSNFVANERVTIYWDRTGTQPIASVTASPSCSLVTSLKVPQAILGKHVIIAVGGTSGRSSSTPFQVQALAFILEPSGNLGAEDGLYGVGFGAGESIVAHWNSSTGPVLGAGKTNGVGSFSPIKFRVPTAPPGTYKVYAVGQGTHATAFATFAFVPSLSISSAYGAVGQTVTIRGTSYGANENVALVWDCASAGCKSATTLGTAVADSTGAFHISVRIPTDADVGTTYAIGAKGRTTGTFGTVSYTVTP